MNLRFASLVGAALAALSLAIVPLSSAVEVKVNQILNDQSFERPVALIAPPDGSKRQFLVEQTGKIKIIEDGKVTGVFLDFSDRAMAEKTFEEGLLGLAFHNNYAENGKFYVFYSQQGPKRSVISELQVSKDNPNAADLSTERILMQIQQPDWNHDSGNLVMGPKDGFLYICAGDGGKKNGVHLLSQMLTSWCGKVLRIDVDGTSPGRPYGIPEDNPFVETKNAAPEIYAYGLRNPWGAWIDPTTNDFWLADVGQDLWEEVNLVKKGGNYGWNYREGNIEFPGRAPLMAALGLGNKVPKGVEFEDPIWVYDRSQGLSITGGFVYRGSKLPELKDHYIVGDWRIGNLWGIKYDPASGSIVSEHKIFTPPAPEVGKKNTFQPTGIYPDLDGEIVILNWDGRVFGIGK